MFSFIPFFFVFNPETCRLRMVKTNAQQAVEGQKTNRDLDSNQIYWKVKIKWKKNNFFFRKSTKQTKYKYCQKKKKTKIKLLHKNEESVEDKFYHLQKWLKAYNRRTKHSWFLRFVPIDHSGFNFSHIITLNLILHVCSNIIYILFFRIIYIIYIVTYKLDYIDHYT